MTKTLIVSFLIGFFVVACITQKQKDRICKNCAIKTVTKDSIKIVVKERLQEIFITDTFTYFLPNPCTKLCDSIGNLKTDFKEVILSNKGTKLNLFVKNNKLVFKDELDSLKRLILVKDSVISNYHSKVIEIESKCKLEHLTWWDKLWIKLGRIFTGIILLFLGYKAFKLYSKT